MRILLVVATTLLLQSPLLACNFCRIGPKSSTAAPAPTRGTASSIVFAPKPKSSLSDNFFASAKKEAPPKAVRAGRRGDDEEEVTVWDAGYQ